MFQPIVFFFFMAVFASSSIAFAPLPSQMKNNKFRGSATESNMKLKVILAPQIIFIASCAGAVFAYVYTNLDSIMEGQRNTIAKVQSEQSSGLKSVQEKQAAELQRVRNEQAANIERARQSARDAQRRN